MLWWVATAFGADRCAALAEQLAARPAPPAALALEVPAAGPTGWADAAGDDTTPGPLAAAAGAGWVVHGGRLWRAADGALVPVDLPFAPDAVVAAGAGVAAVASAAGGRGHLAILGGDGKLRRDLLLDATVTALVARGDELWFTVRGPRPADLDGLLSVREDGADLRLFRCGEVTPHRGPAQRWEGLVALPAHGPPRAVAAALGELPASLGTTVAWAAGSEVRWLGPGDGSPAVGRLPAPATEVRAGRGGVAVRWESGDLQGISVFVARGGALVEAARHGGRDALPDGGDLGPASGWVAWEQEFRDRHVWRVMTVDLATGAATAATGPLPAPAALLDPAAEAAVRALDPAPAWYLPSPGRERLGHVAVGGLDLAASGEGVVARAADGTVRWSARFPAPPPPAAGGYECRAGRGLALRGWDLAKIADTPDPARAGFAPDGSVRFAAEGTLWTWAPGAPPAPLARLPAGTVAVDVGDRPLAATDKGRIYQLDRGWTRLPGRVRATALAAGPSGPLALTDDGEIAALDGTVLGPLDPWGPATALAAGPRRVAAITSGGAVPAGAQVFAGPDRIPLAGIEAPTAIVAPDDVLVLASAGGRAGVWRYGADPVRPDGAERLQPYLRGDVPLFPGGAPPERLAGLAAAGGRVAVRVELRGGGSGVVLLDGCAVTPVVGDEERGFAGAVPAGPHAVGPDGQVLLATPADLDGVWTLWLARPGPSAGDVTIR